MVNSWCVFWLFLNVYFQQGTTQYYSWPAYGPQDQNATMSPYTYQTVLGLNSPSPQNMMGMVPAPYPYYMNMNAYYALLAQQGRPAYPGYPYYPQYMPQGFGYPQWGNVYSPQFGGGSNPPVLTSSLLSMNMTNKKVVLLVMVWCCVFESVCPTQILLNALKNTMSHTRCKLHTIGTEIIAHNHKFGDPCREPPQKHEEDALDTHGNHEIVEPSSDNKGHMNEAKQENQQTGTANHPETSTTEKYRSSLDIDVPMGGSDDKKYPTSNRKYATVPPGGGKRIFKAPCKDGQVESTDGCLEEI